MAITTLVALVGAIATVILNWASLADRFYHGPISVTVGRTECTRSHMTIVLANSGRRAITVTHAALTIRRNGIVERNEIQLAMAPDTVDAGKTAKIVLSATSIDIPIEFPLSGADRCLLEVTLSLGDGYKEATRRATCACP